MACFIFICSLYSDLAPSIAYSRAPAPIHTFSLSVCACLCLSLFLSVCLFQSHTLSLTHTAIHTHTHAQTRNALTCIFFFSISPDKRVIVCEVGKTEALRVFDGHEDEVNFICWDRTGHYLASCSDDCTAKVRGTVCFCRAIGFCRTTVSNRGSIRGRSTAVSQ